MNHEKASQIFTLKNLKIWYFAFLMLFLISTEIHSQADSGKAVINTSLHFHKSFIIQHSSKLSDRFRAAKPWSVDAEISWHLRSRDVWDYCHCYPRTGFTLTYINFDYDEILGRSLAAYAFIEPFIRADRDLNFSIRFGLGPAYMTSIYDSISNPDNLFFSSRYSFIALLNFSINYRFNEHLMARLAGNFNHISNGGYAEPNLGMNFPSLNIGIDYSFKKNAFPAYIKSDGQALYDKKNRFDLVAGGAAKPPSYTIRDKAYPAIHISTRYSRVVGRIFAVTGGAEWLYDRSLKELVRIKDFRDGDGNYLDHNRFSLLAGVEWLFGRFIFSQEFGYYIYSPVEPMMPLYQRYGLNFRITPSFYAGINVKAHAQDADFIEIRIGYTFNH